MSVHVSQRLRESRLGLSVGIWKDKWEEGTKIHASNCILFGPWSKSQAPWTVANYFSSSLSHQIQLKPSKFPPALIQTLASLPSLSHPGSCMCTAFPVWPPAPGLQEAGFHLSWGWGPPAISVPQRSVNKALRWGLKCQCQCSSLC